MTDKTPSTASGEATGGWLTTARAAKLGLGISVLALAGVVVSEFAFESRARSYLLNHPEILQEMMQAQQVEQNNVIAEEIDAAIAANPTLIAADARDPAVGPADAKVTVIQFFDYRCPGCKAVAEDFLRVVQANPDVRFVFKEWPILDRPSDDPVSNYAARAALAAHAQGKYLAVHQALMAEPGLTRESVDRILAENDVDMAQARTAMTRVDTLAHIADIHEAAQTLHLVGTPTFIVNGKTSADIRPDTVARMIADAK